jgi:hypothetical protein
MPDGQVVFEITGDKKPISQTLKETTQEIEKESQKWDKSVQRSTDEMEKSFGKALDVQRIKNWALEAGRYVVDFAKQAISAASDLQEVQNVVDVTFGESGAGKIETWARKAGAQFGLTETQAKRFTSTLGAMMKSAGLAGPEIVNMSTDLAGLAADMASFYNLDFDTAFQKIRSGISGETEPLKQLGINMSVANLQAFALQKGITTAFDKMSQGEQTVLRYQYLMQATADAQGDFARTSDGYANSLRTYQANIETLKTTLGSSFLNVVGKAVGGLNEFLTLLLPDESKKTVLDDFNAIDLNTAEKLGQIRQTAEEARVLIGVLEQIQGDTASKNLENVAESANKLQFGAGLKWGGLISALGDAGVIKTTFDDDMKTAGDNLWSLAYTLNNNAPAEDKVSAWDSILSILTANADGLSTLSGKSPEDTKKWLEELAAGANQLDPTKAESWDTLFTSLVSGLPGLENSEAGKAFFDALTGNFLAMGNQSSEAASGLAALGLTTDEIDTKQKQWLETCRRLVQTIPGLNEIINTETGEVKGGTQAISDYVTEWQEAQEKMALWKAHYARGDALEERRSQEYLYQLDKMTAEERVKRLQAEYERLGGDAKLNELFSIGGTGGTQLERRRLFSLSDNEEEAAIRAAYIDVKVAAAEARNAEKMYNDQVEANAAAVQAYVDEGEALKAQYGELADQAQGVAAETSALSDAQRDAATTAVQQLAPALAALADYYEDVRKATAQQVDSAIGGFEKIVTPAERTRAKLADLNKQLAEAEDKSVIQIQIADANSSLPSVQNMTKALQDQLEYINEYQRNLDEARRRGVSEDLLATLSDGSVESADYLAALATAGKGEVEVLNQAWKDVQAGKETFTDALTAQKLAADETFDGIVAKANETVTALDMADGARDALSSTIEGMALGISDALPSVTAQVDAVLEQMQRLSAFGGFSFSGGALAFGGSSGGLNYDALGDTIRSSAPKAGGSVYLNGRAVGAVVSAEMGNSYRALARSGVQYTSEP